MVRWLGAVQAQDFHAAKWALGLRMRSPTNAIVEAEPKSHKLLLRRRFSSQSNRSQEPLQRPYLPLIKKRSCRISLLRFNNQSHSQVRFWKLSKAQGAIENYLNVAQEYTQQGA